MQSSPHKTPVVQGLENSPVSEHVKSWESDVSGEGMEALHVPRPTHLFLLRVHLDSLSYRFIIDW